MRDKFRQHGEKGFCEHGNSPTTCKQCLEFAEQPVESLEQQAQHVLDTLGLDWEDLKGKDILEIGAGLAVLAQVAKEQGVRVISLDRGPEMWEEEGGVPDDVEYIVGEATALPFKDASLDLVLSKAAPPTISQTKEEVEQVIREAKRVLKDGGVFRFGPGYLHAAIFESSELFTPEEQEEFTLAQRMERIRAKSLEYLQSLDASVHEIGTPDGRFVYELRKED